MHSAPVFSAIPGQQRRRSWSRLYDRVVGLGLENLTVDGCITKAPCGGEAAGKSPVDRGKQGTRRSLLVESTGIPLGCVVTGANQHDFPGLVGCDRPHALAAGTAQRDLLPLRERQAPPLQVPAASGPHPATGSQPHPAALSIRADPLGSPGEELTAGHCLPEPLMHLRNHLPTETHVRHLVSHPAQTGVLRSPCEPGDS